MKRLFVMLTVLSLVFVAGCNNKSQVERKETVSSPTGTTTTTDTHTVESSGENPPANNRGEIGK